MKRYLFLLISILCVTFSYALTIPEGTLYFDNSRTKYQTVCFVYGSEDPAVSYVLPMTLDGNKWRVEIPQTVNDMYRFTFVGGALEEGEYTQKFSDFKEYISKTLNLNRTATSEAQMNAEEIFVPESGDNWAQGYWTSLAAWESSQGGGDPTAAVSGTLPVVYINTTDQAPIVSKEEYLTGSLYIDPLSTGYEALGSELLPISGNFKGRGNYTWRDFDKKPYKIKFDVKQKVLGMPANKHWCLLAHADDNLGFLRNVVGFYLSEQLGMRWTPRYVPVELVLNGQYMGLYFLTEHVRVGKNRVAVTEQDDLATDSVSGGWLVEIDNYHEDGNIEFWEGNGQQVMVTPKSPETLSYQQRQYVTDQLNALNEALYGYSSETLFGMLDIEEAAKYYLIQEIMEDCESYHGSCFLYKNRDRNGQNAKWFFGPVWDFGNAFIRHEQRWIYDNPIFDQIWVGQLANWPVFQKKVQEYWYLFYHDYRNATRTRVNAFTAQITQAAKNDAERWRNTRGYCDNSNMTSRQSDFLSRFNWRVNWLYSQWHEGIQPVQGAESIPTPAPAHKVLRNGQLLIEYEGKTYNLLGQSVQ